MIVPLLVMLMLNYEGQVDTMGWGGKVSSLNLAKRIVCINGRR